MCDMPDVLAVIKFLKHNRRSSEVIKLFNYLAVA